MTIRQDECTVRVVTARIMQPLEDWVTSKFVLKIILKDINHDYVFKALIFCHDMIS